MESCVKFQLQHERPELDQCGLQDSKDFSKENRRGGGWATGPEFQRVAPLLGHPTTPASGISLPLGSFWVESEIHHESAPRPGNEPNAETRPRLALVRRPGVGNFSHCAPHPLTWNSRGN